MRAKHANDALRESHSKSIEMKDRAFWLYRCEKYSVTLILTAGSFGMQPEHCNTQKTLKIIPDHALSVKYVLIYINPGEIAK